MTALCVNAPNMQFIHQMLKLLRGDEIAVIIQLRVGFSDKLQK